MSGAPVHPRPAGVEIVVTARDAPGVLQRLVALAHPWPVRDMAFRCSDGGATLTAVLAVGDARRLAARWGRCVDVLDVVQRPTAAPVAAVAG